MGSRTIFKLGIGVATLLVCGAMYWYLSIRSDKARSSAARDQQKAEWDFAQQVRPVQPPDWPEVPSDDDAPNLPWHTFDRATAIRFHPFLGQGNAREIFDPHALLVLAPYHTLEAKWPEHPTGRVVLKTNNMGFREDTDTKVEKRGFRVLVSGDSHTDGIVYNQESFSNVFEKRLNDQNGGWEFEVINAGVGRTGPYHYLGVLRKNLTLNPDLFVAVIFVGNDFFDALRFHDYFYGRMEKPVGQAYKDRLAEAQRKWANPLAQGINQAYRFKRFPDEAPLSVEAAVYFCDQMASQCESLGIMFATALIPTKLDVDGKHNRANWMACLRALQLSEEEYGINRQLMVHFSQAMQARGIPCVDPTEPMSESEEPCFWKQDYHLNVNGHGILGEELKRVLSPLIRNRLAEERSNP